ncbi:MULTISPECIES: hypothetical protein [unclassified Arenibacter]|uniref:hypothetical protein n=1 Tax=unclassified Arenibacter TaxID=2615047 RepID=UPI000E352E2B|nr:MULTISPECIES: hypothetical protein [unclassified Arenibacter]MCM4162768.1 hypothetical protein [Arenibacter sp. A80]RFT56821.1 hypothetical protein D0S24_04105 [Arenibacter sp. P308M17]
MMKFIARFKAEYPGIDAIQHSCFTWQQDGEIPDKTISTNQIAHTTAIHFFRMYDENVDPDKIIVLIDKIEKFK